MVTKKTMKCDTKDIVYNFEDLVVAVISKAADDYRDAKIKKNKQVQKLRLYPYSTDRQEMVLDDMRKTKREIGELERFFMESEWIDLLPTIDGKYILDSLRKEFK